MATLPKTYKKTHKGMITARCDSRIREILHQISFIENLPQSEIIKESILEYYDKHFPSESFLQKEQALFGRYGSKKDDLAMNRKQYLMESLLEKHRHH